MKILNNIYECPYCKTTVELEQDDLKQWNDIYYYKCPICGKTPHIKGGNLFCHIRIQGKMARNV